jgi:hypothetical protein
LNSFRRIKRTPESNALPLGNKRGIRKKEITSTFISPELTPHLHVLAIRLTLAEQEERKPLRNKIRQGKLIVVSSLRAQRERQKQQYCGS